MLYHKVIGSGSPIIILHGLLGMSDNWMTVARELGLNRQVILMDQRNHGRSFHSDYMDYDLMAQDVFELVKDNDWQKPDLLGHSMGGKTAMRYAQLYPEYSGKVVSVDIAPKRYEPTHDKIFSELLKINLSNHHLRSLVDEELTEGIGDHSTRQFLLKNLTRKDSKFIWKANIPGIYNSYSDILDFPKPNEKPSKVSILFIQALRSTYLSRNDFDHISSYFSDFRVSSVDAGHWVHAEKPKELMDILNRFLHKLE